MVINLLQHTRKMVLVSSPESVIQGFAVGVDMVGRAKGQRQAVRHPLARQVSLSLHTPYAGPMRSGD